MGYASRFSKIVLLLSLLLSVFAAARENPVANPNAVVTSGDVRFTVLTEQLIRME